MKNREALREEKHSSDDPFIGVLTKVVVDNGRRLALKMFAERFAAAGIRLTSSERESFSRYLDGSGDEPIISRRRNSKLPTPVVRLTPEDNRKFKDQLHKLVKIAAGTIPKIQDDTAASRLKAFRGAWKRHEKSEVQSMRGFQERLARRWRSPLSLLHLQIAVSRDLGSFVAAAIRIEGVSSPCLIDVVTRLHARACQIGMEVHCLLAAGLADGAMARCRTLHEIAVTAFCVKEHGEPTAERYILHEGIESWRAACELNRHARALGERRISTGRMKALERQRAELLDKFGRSFDGHYGWASHVLKHGATAPITSFADIESAVMPHLRPYYQLASHNVHAKSKGIYHRLGLIDQNEVLLSGASNVGLSEPGQNAALFLYQINAALGMLHPTFDTITTVKLLGRLEREVSSEFSRVHLEMLNDDRLARHRSRTAR